MKKAKTYFFFKINSKEKYVLENAKKYAREQIKNLDGSKKLFVMLKKVTFEIPDHLKKVNNFKLL